MNREELMALAVEREKKGQAWTTIPTCDLKELLEAYRQPFAGTPWPQPMEIDG